MSPTSLPRRSWAFSVLTCRLRCRIASCTALERTRSKFEAPMTRTKANGSTILNFRKNSIALSGTFSRVGQTATGASEVRDLRRRIDHELDPVPRPPEIVPSRRECALDPPVARAYPGRALLDLDDG